MPKDVDSTIKFKADITDLKASMQEAGRYIRLANSEFKAATAGMDNWSRSADGLAAKTKQLNTILQAQKQQLAALEADYKKVVKEQGEHSKGAEELKIKINNQNAAIAQTEAQLNKYEKELKDVTKGTEEAAEAADEAANGGFTVLKGVMANLAAEGVMALANGLKSLIGTLVDVGKQAIDSYAEFEQLAGGVSKLFGTGGQSLEEYAASVGKTTEEAEADFRALEAAQDDVMKNAQQAYKTAGMSANQYMETVTSFSASLISGLEGDTTAAVKYADMAIRDMSDNANTFGTDISMIQNAYQGFAKQNYTMLDNLKLGYGGNATEMARLVNESGVLGDEIEVTAETVKNVPFDKIIEAINVTQQRMKITGTTAREAAGTIQGSVGSVQAAWENLLTGMANDDADFDTLMGNFVDSLMGTIGNLVPRIKTVIGGIGQLVTGLVQELFPVIIDLINSELPGLVEMGTQVLETMLAGLITLINEELPSLVEMGGKLLLTLITGIIDALPELASTAITIVTQLIRGLATALPQIIYAIINAVPQIIQALLSQIPTFLRACVTFLMAIVQAIPTIVRAISIQLPQIINAIVSTLIASIPIILNGAVRLLGGLLEAIPVIINALGEALPTIIEAITQAFIDGLPLILEGAINIFMTLIEAIPVILDALTENLPKIIEAIFNSLLDALPVILDASITLFMSLIDALPTIIRALVVNLPRLITTIITVLLENLPVIISASIQLFMGLLEAIPKIIVELGKNLPEIIKAIVDGLGEGLKDIVDVGESLIQGLWNGISNMGDWIGEKIQGFGEGVVDSLKNFFGIASPSKLFRDEIGKWLPPGITVGFEKAMPQAVKNMAGAAKEMAQDIANEMAVPLEDMAVSAGQVKGIQSLNGNGGSFANVDGGTANGTKSIVFNQTINSPEPVSRLTVFRDTNSLLFSAGVRLNNV